MQKFPSEEHIQLWLTRRGWDWKGTENIGYHAIAAKVPLQVAIMSSTVHSRLFLRTLPALQPGERAQTAREAIAAVDGQIIIARLCIELRERKT